MLLSVKRLLSKMQCDSEDKILESVSKKAPDHCHIHSNTRGETMSSYQCQSTDRPHIALTAANSVSSGDYTIDIRHVDALDRDTLGVNASIPFATIQSSGPPSRPLEFPAPIVDQAVTAAADIIDHRTGNIFLATNVLMRRPAHSKNCASHRRTTSQSGSFDAHNTRPLGHDRRKFPDTIHTSWQPAFTSPYDSLPTATKRKQHRRAHSHSNSTQERPCGPECYLPNKAYCIRKKICNTTYGSVRLCVVLKRVSQNVMNYARTVSSEENQIHSSPHRGVGNQIHSSPNREISRDAERVPEWETTDEMVAIKVVKWSKLQSLRGRHLEDPVKEVAALQQLIGKTHPNITSISDVLQDETHLFSVYPYIGGGDLCGSLLDNMANSPTGRIDEDLGRTWFRQILSAINYLQKKGICHRDLCLESMMVDQQDNISIIDFGLCLRVPFTDPSNRGFVTDVSANTSRRLMKTQGQCGHLESMAPEISMRSDSFDGFATDLWAAGIVLFELLIGKKPFTMPDPVDINFQTISVEGNLDLLLQAKGIELDPTAVKLLQGMMWCDPAKRLTLSQIVNHPWVQGKGKRAMPSVEEDGVDNRWFINNKSIDDMDGDGAKKSTHSIITGLMRSTPSNDGDASTSFSSDAASQALLSQASYDDSSHQSSFREPSVDLAEPHGDVELDSLNEKNTPKKQSWFRSLKNVKALRAVQ